MEGLWQRFWQGVSSLAWIGIIAGLAGWAGKLFITATLRLNPDFFSRKTWERIRWISFIVLICSLMVFTYVHMIMPNLKEIIKFWPIILLSGGALLFVSGIGAFYYFKQQLNETTNLHSEISAQSARINQLEVIIKKRIRLSLLKDGIIKLKDLKDHYDDIAPKRYNLYLTERNPDRTLEFMSISPDYHVTTNQIKHLAENTFGIKIEDIDFDDIDPKKLEKRFPEEDRIVDTSKRDTYRKAKYQYEKGKEIIKKLMDRFSREIMECEEFINAYAQGMNLPQ